MTKEKIDANQIVDKFFPDRLYNIPNQRWPGGWVYFKDRIRAAIQAALDDKTPREGCK